MPNLIGTAPNQVPVNGLLGTLAFQDSTSVKVGSLTATSVTATTVTGALTGNATTATTAALCSGNAATVTNGVYTAGDQTIGGNKTFSSSIIGSITGNSATVTNGVYTSGDQTIGGNKTFSNTILGSVSGATGVFTGDIQSTSLNGGQLAGLRNKLINGNMGIFQRGTAAVTTNGGYGPADRWLTNTTGNTFSATQGSFVSGDTLYDTGGAQYFTQVAVTSVAAATNNTLFFQYIEDVRLLAGQTVTVSFWAKAAAGTPSIGVEIAQFFGTGGSPSATATGTGQAQALTTTWTKYSKTFAVPSISGKTIGTTANTSSTAAVFWLDAGSNFNTRSGSIGQSPKTVSIAQVQLEIGSVATPFEFRPIGMELALCQRYFESVSPLFLVQNSGASTPFFVPYTTKRVAPTIATTSWPGVNTGIIALNVYSGCFLTGSVNTSVAALTASAEL